MAQTRVDAGKNASLVTAARCPDYELAAVRAALGRALFPLGGMERFVSPGERIVLKPNLLFAAAPEQAITAHPAVVAAVALAVREAGGIPIVAESPGSGIVHVKPVIERVYRKTGLREVADRHGFELSHDMRWENVTYADGRLVRRLEIISPILEADGVINIAKLKTHAFMTYTGATKNLFGVIPGLNKVGYHGRLADPSRFAGMLLDVAGFVNPRLNIVDGILALEGMGPGTGGRPRLLGALVAGQDAVAVDVACCRIVGIDTSSVPVLAEAHNRGLWSGRALDVETVGISVSELRVTDFVLPSRQSRDIGLTHSVLVEAVIRPVLRRGFTPVPRPKGDRCVACGACSRACPCEAIEVSSGCARVDDSLCIRCYCCHEVCPHAAIDLEFKGMGRAMHRMGLV